MNVLQDTLPGTKVELTFLRDGKEEQTGPDDRDGAGLDRSVQPRPRVSLRADDVRDARRFARRDAWRSAANRTLDDVTVVFRSVRALGTGQVPLRGLAGPWTIIKVALQAADEGTVELLLFLTFLSANLAVLNFLPIPVLDGGHFVLLAYEGIRGKPANESVQTVLAYIGLASHPGADGLGARDWIST